MLPELVFGRQQRHNPKPSLLKLIEITGKLPRNHWLWQPLDHLDLTKREPHELPSGYLT